MARNLPRMDDAQTLALGIVVVGGLLVMLYWPPREIWTAYRWWLGIGSIAVLILYGFFASRAWMATLLSVLLVAVAVVLEYRDGSGCDGDPACSDDLSRQDVILLVGAFWGGAVLVGGLLALVIRRVWPTPAR